MKDDKLVMHSHVCIPDHTVLSPLTVTSLFFFFKQKTAYEMSLRDWSSDGALPIWPGTLVPLEPLTHEESATLLDELDVPADARSRIADAAEGNPLFLEQMVAMLADEVPTEMPPTIHALLTARLDRLEPFEQSVLQRAAVVGKDFSRDAVVELSPEDERAQVAATLLSLTRKELVRPDHSGFADDDGFRFRHALIRDAAYAEVPKGVRTELHARFAAWLEPRE